MEDLSLFLHFVSPHFLYIHLCGSKADLVTRFTCSNAVFIPTIWLLYPETNKLTLEQIDHLFMGDKIKLHWRPDMVSEENPVLPHSPSSESTDSGDEKVEVRNTETSE